MSWRAGLLLLAALVAVAIYAWISRPQPAPPTPMFLNCPSQDVVFVRLEGTGRVTELQRVTPRDEWRVTQPRAAPADSSSVAYLTNAIASIRVLNTVDRPGAPSAYGLDAPRETLTCRVDSGPSYTLSIGHQSFDGSGFYARKASDSRVFVISGVEVDAFDRALAEPPVKPTPSPPQP